MTKREIDPLLIKEKSSISDNGGNRYHSSYGTGHSRLICVILGVLGIMIVILGATVWNDQNKSNNLYLPPNTGVDPKTLVQRMKDGDYVVNYAHDFSSGEKVSFGALAQIMLPPWYEATVMALEALTPDMTPDQLDVKQTRLVLRKTRDLLDVFSPVFPTRSIWRSVRLYYKDGYELVGYFHDLAASKVEYSQDMLEERLKDVLEWKVKFENYALAHDIRAFLNSKVTKAGCYDHKESHLFWENLESSDDDTLEGAARVTLPCSNDWAASGLGRLAVVQLDHALDYLDTVLTYETVLSTDHQLDYHNLRKELRVFLDEVDLFGFALFPYDSDVVKKSLSTIRVAVKKIGVINDKWNAYSIYTKEDTHHSEQEQLAGEIDGLWTKFKDWTSTSDLVSAIHSLFDILNDEIGKQT